jgi:hypothetical protein
VSAAVLAVVWTYGLGAVWMVADLVLLIVLVVGYYVKVVVPSRELRRAPAEHRQSRATGVGVAVAGDTVPTGPSVAAADRPTTTRSGDAIPRRRRDAARDAGHRVTPSSSAG